MIVSQEQLERLFAGELLDHHSKRTPSEWDGFMWRCRFKPGESYAACLYGKSASCRVKVITVVPLGEEGWRLRLQIDRVREERPVYLQRSGGKPRGTHHPDDPIARGYTHMPAKALRDAGEVIDDETLGRYSKEAQERHAAFLEGLDSRPLHEQLAYALEGAELVGVDHRHEQMVIRRKIRTLLRKIDQRAA